jgi:DNA-binding PucR family transcriptional regulator
LLAASVTATTPLLPDELALQHAAAAAPWMLVTLDVVAGSASMRAAAATLQVHHSTLQERITHAERLLGWNIRRPHGSHRLYLALALRRLRRHPPAS